MPLVDLIEQDIEQAAEHFERFHQRFAHHFATTTRTMNQEAKHYSHGQLTCEKKGNLWEFEKTVPESESQSMQHFISNSPWEDDPLLDDVNQAAMSRIGDATHGAIHIDESGFEKCGNMSVGVARQYCGRLGKVENCQMGVFLGYTQATHRILLDRRLYLPEPWISDKARRKKCGVPKDTTFCTKAELGLELIRTADERKLPYAFIGFHWLSLASIAIMANSLGYLKPLRMKIRLISPMYRVRPASGWLVHSLRFRLEKGIEVGFPLNRRLSTTNPRLSKFGS